MNMRLDITHSRSHAGKGDEDAGEGSKKLPAVAFWRGGGSDWKVQ